MSFKAEFNNVEDTRRMIVKSMGNSSHVYLPRDWKGREVMVLLLGNDNEE